jgi:hypothetical protein
MVSEKSFERKRRSEEICKFEGVPVNPHLPVIEDESEAKLRTVEEVARRAMALGIVSVKGEGLEQERILEIIEQYNLQNAFSPKEKEFIDHENPSELERIQFTWRYEGYWVLLWSLNYIDELGKPDQVCDVPRAMRIMIDSRNAESFIKNARLRNISEILDAADLIYRYDWACVDARLNGKPTPGGLDSGVVYERHYALNWLIGYMQQNWDHISTDT